MSQEFAEAPAPITAHHILEEIFPTFSPTDEDTPDSQERGKILNDGTEIIIHKYVEPEPGGSEEIDTFSVTVNQEDGGLSFAITKNGLVDYDISMKAGGHVLGVPLSSVVQPQPGENTEVEYGPKGLQTEESYYRKAATPLAHWVKQIIGDDRYSRPPVRINEKPRPANI